MNEEVLLDIKVQDQDAIDNINKLTQANALLKAQLGALDKTATDYGGKSAVITAQIKENTAGIRENSKELKTNAAAVASADTSINGMRSRVSDLQKSYNSLSATAREGSVGKAISAEMLQLNTSVNKANLSVGNFKDNIGNYAGTLGMLPGPIGQIASTAEQGFGIVAKGFSSMKAATTEYIASIEAQKAAKEAALIADKAAIASELELSLAQKAGTATSEQAAAAELLRGTATESAAVATDVSSASLKLFKIALVSTGIGAIVVLLGSLVAWFSQTEKGTLAMNKGLAVVGTLFKEFAGFLAKTVQGVIDFVGGIKSFPDLMTKIGDAIKENLLNRLKSIGTLFTGLVDIFKGDFVKGAKEVVDGLGGIGTGVLNITDKVAKIGKAVALSVSDAAISAAKIEQMKKDLEDYEIDSTVALAKLEAKAAEYKVILGKAGQSMTTKEREDAVNGLIKNEDEQLKIRLNGAQRKAAIAKAELDLEQKQTGDAKDESRKKYADSLAELIKMRGEYNVTKMTVEARASKLYLDLLNIDIQAEKDSYTQSKTMLENKVKNEQLSLDERAAINVKLKDIEDANYKQQTDSFQQYMNGIASVKGKGTKTQIDFNELMQISDSEVLTARMTDLDISAKAQKVLLTMLNDRKTEIIALNQTDIQIAKDRATRLISEMQNEIKLNDLKNKELRAGRQTTYEEDKQDLSQKYTADLAALDLQHSTGLISEQKYRDDLKLLNQQNDTDDAILDAQNAENQLQNKANQLSDELEIVQGNIDAETEIKHKQFEADRVNELRAKDLTESQKLAINKKYLVLNKKLDDDATGARLDQAKIITDGLVNLFGKATIAGKLAASASVAIDTYKGAQAAIATMGSTPIGMIFGIAQAAVIVAGGIKAIADINAVSADTTPSINSTAPTAPVTPSTIYTNLPNLSSMYSNSATQTETTQTIQNSQPQPVVRVTEITNMQNTVKVKENSKL